MVRYMHVGRRAGRAAGTGRRAGARPAFARWFGRWPWRRAVRPGAAFRPVRAEAREKAPAFMTDLRRAVWPGWEYGEAYVPSWAAASWRVPPVPAAAADVRDRLEAALLVLVARSGAEQVGADEGPEAW